jgi:hypothetical protein
MLSLRVIPSCWEYVIAVACVVASDGNSFLRYKGYDPGFTFLDGSNDSIRIIPEYTDICPVLAIRHRPISTKDSK